MIHFLSGAPTSSIVGATASLLLAEPAPVATRATADYVPPELAQLTKPASSELRELVDMAGAESVIEDDERQMIHSVFELADTVAREVMVPRTEMVWIERTKTLRQAMSLSLRSGYSRIPVIGESVDDVIGVVYMKDIARRIFEHADAQGTERCHSKSSMSPW